MKKAGLFILVFLGWVTVATPLIQTAQAKPLSKGMPWLPLLLVEDKPTGNGTGPILTGPAAVKSGLSFALSWTYTWGMFVTNNDGYELQESTTLPTSGFSQIWSSKWQNDRQSPKTIVITARQAGTYYYRVRAYIGQFSKYSDWSNIHQVIVTDATAAVPSAPSGLTTSAVSETQVTLSWQDNSNNEDGFKIHRAANSCANPFAPLGDVGADVTSETITGLSPGTTACYRITAFNSSGESGPSNNKLVTTLVGGGGPPPKPTITNVEFLNLSTVRLTWNDVDGENEYKLEASYGSSDSFFEVTSIPSGNTYWDVHSLPACSTTYFRLRARNQDSYSGYSNVVSAETNAVAKIQIASIWTGPLKPGIYEIGCNASSGNGGFGVIDDDANGLVDLETSGNQNYLWPRWNIVDIGCIGCAVQLVVGKQYYPGTNLALFFRHPDWEVNPSQYGAFVSVFYSVSNQGGQLSANPVSMTGGDLSYPYNGLYPIVMLTNSGQPSPMDHPYPYFTLPTGQQAGRFGGAVSALISNQTDMGFYDAQVYILDMNVPLYVDDR